MQEIMKCLFGYNENQVWILEHSLCFVYHFHISILSSSHYHLLKMCSHYQTTSLYPSKTDPAD